MIKGIQIVFNILFVLNKPKYLYFYWLTEEILTTNNAIWWSEDGKKLSFVCFNDTKVDVLQYPHYGDYDDVNNVYPELKKLSYPKVHFVCS